MDSASVASSTGSFYTRSSRHHMVSNVEDYPVTTVADWRATRWPTGCPSVHQVLGARGLDHKHHRLASATVGVEWAFTSAWCVPQPGPKPPWLASRNQV
jgi:hypothetical protein